MSIRVAVAGAAGRMGRTVVKAVQEDPETDLVAAVDLSCLGEDAGTLGGCAHAGVGLSNDLEASLRRAGAEVLVDFTRGDSAHGNALKALALGVSPVIGTTGMSATQVEEIEGLARERGVGALIAP